MDYSLHTQVLHGAADLLRGLIEIGSKAPAIEDRPKLFATVLSEIRRLARAEAGNLYVLRHDGLERAAWQNDAEGFSIFSLPQPDVDRLNSTQSVPGYVAATGEVVLLDDASLIPADAPYASDRDPTDAYTVRTLIAVPLTLPGGRCVGVVELFNRVGATGRGESFPDPTVSGLDALATLSAVTLHTALARDDIESLLLDTIIRLSAVAERRDNASADHVRRMSLAAGLIACAMEMDPHEVMLIEFATPMHDIGKAGVPESILHKTESLTPQERIAVEDHAVLGADMLSGGSGLIEMARIIACSHHERWDGMGYPDGLIGKDIPAAGRIVALADAFDVLLSDRAYRDAYGLAKVLITIRSERGRQFDPDVVDAFFKVLDKILVVYDLSDPVAAMTGPAASQDN
jgi:HD-GYP domain-containing protein (c-di-GMP phosphodiesterase class II)